MRTDTERNKKLVTAYADGASSAALATEYGITRQRLHQILDKMGVTEKHPRGTPKQPPRVAKCEWCEREFSPATRDTRFCGQKCSGLASTRFLDSREQYAMRLIQGGAGFQTACKLESASSGQPPMNPRVLATRLHRRGIAVPKTIMMACRKCKQLFKTKRCSFADGLVFLCVGCR